MLLNQGELIRDIPDYVEVINANLDPTPVHSKKGLRNIKKTALQRLFSHGNIVKMSGYLLSNFIDMKKNRTYRNDKLLWRVIAESTERLPKEYDVAVSFLEGGAAYYVSKFVKAKRKACFIHIDYISAGYSRKLDEDCYFAFDKIFPVSEAVKETFTRLYPELEARVETFENLIDIEGIENKSLEPGGFEDDFEGVRILSIGRLTPQKSFNISVDAMKLLKQKGLNVKWYVLGEGSQRKTLERQIEQAGLSGEFLLLGNKDNPFPYIRQCDLYVHASRYEGKSMAVQEARVCKRPIIVTNCGGNREQVMDGIDGLLCEFEAKDIALKIERLLNNKEEARLMGERAREGILRCQNDIDNLRKFTDFVGQE